MRNPGVYGGFIVPGWTLLNYTVLYLGYWTAILAELQLIVKYYLTLGCPIAIIVQLSEYIDYEVL